jgi:hypothetical protein
MKDAQDLKLEALFASSPIADDGFSARIEKRIRRRSLVRQFAMPVAVLLGGIVALKPMIELVSGILRFLTLSSGELGAQLSGLTASSVPSLTMIIGGSMLALAFVLLSQFLGE